MTCPALTHLPSEVWLLSYLRSMDGDNPVVVQNANESGAVTILFEIGPATVEIVCHVHHDASAGGMYRGADGHRELGDELAMGVGWL